MKSIALLVGMMSAFGAIGFLAWQNQIQAENLAAVQAQIEKLAAPALVPTSGEIPSRDELIAEVKQQLQNEMGLLSIALMRDRSKSFVEMNTYDNRGSSSYGTASYLGRGYFLTVKHGVSSFEEGRQVQSVKLMYKGRPLDARIVDVGDAKGEVEYGDWAIIMVKEKIDLPTLNINTGFKFEFAEPIFRLGNDYSRGIVVATGYIGQRLPNKLITCLTDGHPGVSGGGVLDRNGDLVGIPIGRMQGDFKFSFILPLRKEMFRKVPFLLER